MLSHVNFLSHHYNVMFQTRAAATGKARSAVGDDKKKREGVVKFRVM